MAKKHETEQETQASIDALWVEIYTLKQYYESLKFRDTIIGRLALVLSVAWMFVNISESLHWFEVLPAFLFIMLLYWVAQNGYFATIAALLSIVQENNFNPWLKNTDRLGEEDIKRIEEQRVLLANYAVASPKLPLLYFIHENSAKKIVYPPYQFFANNPRFRKKLKVNLMMNFFAHFLPCERYTNKKYRVMVSIEKKIYQPPR